MEKLLKNLKDIDANMNIKVHFLCSLQDEFLDNCNDVSDEQGEWFQQDIKTMEEHYQGWWDKLMMADYRRIIKKDLNNIQHDRQSRKRKFLP